MSNIDFKKGLIGIDSSLMESLRVIDQAVTGIALIVDAEQHLKGVLTDGDIRRALLTGAALNDTVGDHMQGKFVSVDPLVGRSEVLDLMQARSLDQVPVLNDEGKLLGLHTMHQLLGREERPNWAVIMAGGKGTRLGKLTENTPKPMLTVAGKPILERIVLHLVSYGIRRIFLSVNYLSHVIEDYFGDGSKFGCQIEYLREDEPLGTGGALSLLPEKSSHSLLVMNGDLVMQTNFSNMLAFHREGGHFATMGLRPYTHEVAFGCAEVSAGALTSLVEKPVLQQMVNAGVYVLSPDAIQSVPNDTFFPITGLFERAIEGGQSCGAFLIEDDWLDVGQPAELSQARGQA